MVILWRGLSRKILKLELEVALLSHNDFYFENTNSASRLSSIDGDMAGIEFRNGLRRAVQCLKRPSPQYTSHIPRRRPIKPTSYHSPNIARQFSISCRRSLGPTRPTEPSEPDFQAAPPLEGLEEEEVYYEPLSTDPRIAAMERAIYESYRNLLFSPAEAAEATKTALARRLASFDATCYNNIQSGMSSQRANVLRQQEIDDFTNSLPIDQAAQIAMDGLMERGLSYDDALEIVNEELADEEEQDLSEFTEEERTIIEGENGEEDLDKAELEALRKWSEGEGEEDEDEVEYKDPKEKKREELMARIRIVPASPSYFTGKPNFTDDLISLKALLRKYQLLPVFPPGQAPRVAWKSVEQYKAMVGAEPVKSARYQRLLEILKRLNSINSAIMPEEVSDTLSRYKRAVDLSQARKKQGYVNADGIALGVGRRKTSTARAYLVEGEGEVLVNGKSLTQFFARLHDRASAVWALKATERVDKYNVFALVKGGGATGQAEALTLAVAKALLVHEPLLKPALRRGTSNPTFPSIICNANSLYSWLCNPRSPQSRKEKTRPSQGSQKACLGQALISQPALFVYLYYIHVCFSCTSNHPS